MSTVRLGIIMNGVTGRMGTNQHLVRSICAIRAQGGVRLADGRRVMPDPILAGRNRPKLEALAKAHGIERVTTDLDAAFRHPDDTVYFDAASTGLRPDLIRKAIAAGKHVYTEKPVAPTPIASISHTSNSRLAIANEPTVHSTKMTGMMIVRGTRTIASSGFTRNRPKNSIASVASSVIATTS